jgi:hypothetical protein
LSCELALIEGGGLDQPGSAFLAQAIAVAADGDYLAVMEQPVEDGGGDDRIAEDGAPFADRAIRGDQHAAALVADFSATLTAQITLKSNHQYTGQVHIALTEIDHEAGDATRTYHFTGISHVHGDTRVPGRLTGPFPSSEVKEHV